jgi:uncharacterized protein (DUF1330 family)
MNTKYKIALAVLAGAGLGAAAMQGLHAQAKPKAYIVSESEVLDAAANDAYRPLIIAAIQAAGGRRLAPPGGKTVAFVGEAPKRVSISEWESLEKAQAYQNSEAYKNLAPQRDKAIKIIRSFAIEGAAN